MSQTERATNYIFSSFSLVFANRGASRGSSATYDLFSCLFAVLKLFSAYFQLLSAPALFALWYKFSFSYCLLR